MADEERPVGASQGTPADDETSVVLPPASGPQPGAPPAVSAPAPGFGPPPTPVPPPAYGSPPGYGAPQGPPGYGSTPGYGPTPSSGYPPQLQGPPPGYPPPGYPPQPQGPPPGYPPQPLGQPPGYPSPSYPPPGYPAQGYAPPYAGYPAPYPAYARRGSGRGLKIFVVLLLLLLLAVSLVVVGIATGAIKTNQLLGLLGMGPGQIYVENASDQPVVIRIERIGEEGSAVRTFEETIAPADVRSYPDRQPGTWDLRFEGPGGQVIGTCDLAVAGNGVYTFIVLPDVIAVARAGAGATNGDDLVVDTSPLCSQGGS